jgi:hypothetical protein
MARLDPVPQATGSGFVVGAGRRPHMDGQFVLFSDEARRVAEAVVPPAFDLSGWLDLTNLRSGDIVETEVRVSFADRHDVLFERTRFEKHGLMVFADLAKGQNHLAGSSIDVILRQAESADNFATQIELAYQFIVESQ